MAFSPLADRRMRCKLPLLQVNSFALQVAFINTHAMSATFSLTLLHFFHEPTFSVRTFCIIILSYVTIVYFLDGCRDLMRQSRQTLGRITAVGAMDCRGSE